MTDLKRALTPKSLSERFRSLALNFSKNPVGRGNQGAQLGVVSAWSAGSEHKFSLSLSGTEELRLQSALSTSLLLVTIAAAVLHFRTSSGVLARSFRT